MMYDLINNTEQQMNDNPTWIIKAVFYNNHLNPSYLEVIIQDAAEKSERKCLGCLVFYKDDFGKFDNLFTYILGNINNHRVWVLTFNDILADKIQGNEFMYNLLSDTAKVYLRLKYGDIN